jgi:hypothetical protein
MSLDEASKFMSSSQSQGGLGMLQQFLSNIATGSIPIGTFDLIDEMQEYPERPLSHILISLRARKPSSDASRQLQPYLDSQWLFSEGALHVDHLGLIDLVSNRISNPRWLRELAEAKNGM